MAEKIQWRNRIVERKMMRVGELKPFNLNPKHHPHVQKERLKAILDKFGIVGEILAFRDDKGDLVCFDGHARQGLDPNQEWPVNVLDLTLLEVQELILFFDPVAALAQYDSPRQMDLMQDLRSVDGVLGDFLDELAKDSGFKRNQPQAKNTKGNGKSKLPSVCPHCGKELV